MNKIKTFVTATTLLTIIGTGVAMAGPHHWLGGKHNGQGPYYDCPYYDNGYCPYGYDHNYSARGARNNDPRLYGPRAPRGPGMETQLMQIANDYPQFAQDINVLLDLRDQLFTERNVLRALEQQTDVDISDLRKQSQLVRSLERQTHTLQLTLNNKFIDAGIFTNMMDTPEPPVPPRGNGSPASSFNGPKGAK